MRGLLTAFPMVLLLSAASGDDNIGPTAKYRRIGEHLSDVIRTELERQDIPSFSIAIVDGKQIVWAQGFGFADAKQTTRATARTVYRVGSVSKLLTDLAIMQCVEQGRIDLDAPISIYDKEFTPENPFGEAITLRHLASHRAGIVREPPVGHYFDPTEPSLLDTVRSLNRTRLVYEPSTRTKYSNAGVSVIGQILARITNQSFEAAMLKNILQPLGMTDSRFELNESLRTRLAEGAMWTHDGRKFAAPTFELGTAPAGNLYSTVIDLGKFAIALFNEGRGEQEPLLKASTLAEMMSPQSDDPSGFGIGFHVSDFRGQKLVGHSGAVYGFSTQFYAIPQKEVAVICIAAKDVANGTVRRIAKHALTCALQDDETDFPKFKVTGPLPITRARVLDGHYREQDSDRCVELRESNGRLMLMGFELTREIRANANQLIADDVFGYGPAMERIDDDTWKMNGKTYHRIDNPLPPPLPARWQGIVGEYGWDHNTLFIYERQGQLWCLIEWIFHYPLIEIEEGQDRKKRFCFPSNGLYQDEELCFQLDDKGRAERVVAAQVTFQRRPIGPADGETFRIHPVQPIARVREIAAAATMPAKLGVAKRQADLVEITSLDDSIKLDIRYASRNNFMNAVFYDQPQAFLQRDAATALVKAHRRLHEKGYGLLIHDAYRPWFVTKMFWEATPASQKIFVANPANGSRHNRGCAVDLTLYELDNGRPVPMGAGYDEFSPRSFPNYPVADSRARWHRELLRDAMEHAGFTIYEFEWWHFDYQDWQNYPVLNTSFEDLRR